VTEHTICKLAQSCEEMPGSPDHCQTHRCNMEFPCRDALLLVIGDLKHDYDRLAAHENALHQIIEQAEARETALREALPAIADELELIAFEWESHTPMPFSLIEAIEKRWPEEPQDEDLREALLNAASVARALSGEGSNQ
jgi:hypothetical protein